ncbi:MAG: acyl-CoA dehydrogenase family protein, partial [Dehalococcoidia bacterium]|nr:acyl-CoA dehydrogenase family protein [Dehalococcoidia bacterium]
MDFGLTETQELLRKSTRQFLAERSKPADVRAMAEDERGYGEDLWRDVAGLGWAGLLVPEQHGGAGLSFADMAVLLEEWGASLAPGPLVETAVLAADVIARFGDDRQKREYLPRLAAGELVVAPAVTDALASAWGGPAPSGTAVTASLRRGTWRLNGQKIFVSYAKSAGAYLVSARREGTGEPDVFLVARDSVGESAITPLLSASGRSTCAMDFRDLPVPAGARLGGDEDGGAVMARLNPLGAAARALQMAGAARRVLEITVQYVSNRRQFGRAVGSFQAIQHKLADMALMLQGARHTAYRAAWELSEG